ncbi:hypothetical protein [Kitasatospora arboriphila]|uniref:Uncharacterized protein n=1 Tax=Kitasatospora arboriphila TaxID=258052 RepID=A0ABP4EQ95_9ACTN
MTTPDDDRAHPDEETRERSAEERSITAPTPADVRAKGGDDDGEEPEPPAADAVAP